MESSKLTLDRPKLNLQKDTLRRLGQDDARSVAGMGGDDAAALERLKHMTM